MEVKLMNYTTNPLQNIEEAASTCYNSEPSETGSITKLCYLSHHESVLEHTSFTFKIYGVSRALMAQLTRHRVASFSVESQRYVDQTTQQCVVPPSIRNNPEALRLYLHVLNVSKTAYTKLEELKIPKEDARFCLPEGTCTCITFTMNLRELSHFCGLRRCSRSQWQIRQLADEVARVVNEATENVFDYMLKPRCESHIPYYCPESKNACCGRHETLSQLLSGKANGEATT